MTLDEFIKRVDEGFAGKPMPHTAKPLGLKKIKKGGKTYYVPINSDPRRGEGNKVMDNFADGKKPGRKGISKRLSVCPTKQIFYFIPIEIIGGHYVCIVMKY